MEGVSKCEELVWDENQLPVQSNMHTFLVKKLSRLESQFPRGFMDRLILNADKKMQTNCERDFPSLTIAGFERIGNRVRIPLIAHNISD